jgi:hypothetical protein
VDRAGKGAKGKFVDLVFGEDKVHSGKTGGWIDPEDKEAPGIRQFKNTGARSLTAEDAERGEIRLRRKKNMGKDLTAENAEGRKKNPFENNRVQ